MKRKACFVILNFFGSILLTYAAPPAADPCTDKYNSCVTSCTNGEFSCKHRGVEASDCAQRAKVCKNDCAKAQKTCQEKNAPPKTVVKKTTVKKTTTTKSTDPNQK